MVHALTPIGPSSSNSDSFSGRRQRIAAYLVKRRVRISLIVFAALMVADVLMGVEPHSVFNPREPASLVGCMLVFAGLAVRSWAAGVLKKTRELTTTGPYAVIRNPLYIGSFLIMSGFCTIIGDPANILVVLGPIAGLYFLQVRHEERALSQRYEGRWTEYARRVPRFFPRALPPAPCAAWSVDQWLGNREYRALGAALVGLLAVHAWHLS